MRFFSIFYKDILQFLKLGVSLIKNLDCILMTNSILY